MNANRLSLFVLAALPIAALGQVIYDTSFESTETPSYSMFFGTPQGNVAGQGGTNAATSWATPLNTLSVPTEFLVQNDIRRTGLQAIFFNSGSLLGTSAVMNRTMRSAVGGGTLGVSSGMVMTQLAVWNSSADGGESALGISTARGDTTFSSVQPEFGGVFIGATGNVYVRTGQSISLPSGNLKLSNLAAVPANTWHVLSLVQVPTTRKTIAFINGDLVTVSGGLPAEVTAATSTAASVGQVNVWIYAAGAIATSLGVSSGGGFNTQFFDDFRMERFASTTSVRIACTLQDFIGSPAGLPVVVQKRTAGGGSWSPVGTVLMNSRGEVTFDALATGNYDFRLKPMHSLAKTLTNVNVGSYGSLFNTATIVNGDVDASGEVDAADIDAVIAEFGNFGSVGTIASDVDGSTEVDAADIDVVIANFGAFDN